MAGMVNGNERSEIAGYNGQNKMQTSTLTRCARCAMFSLSNGTTTCKPIIYNIYIYVAKSPLELFRHCPGSWRNISKLVYFSLRLFELPRKKKCENSFAFGNAKTRWDRISFAPSMLLLPFRMENENGFTLDRARSGGRWCDGRIFTDVHLSVMTAIVNRIDSERALSRNEKKNRT